VGPFGVSSVTDLAIDNDGSMYCITFSALYSVDPTTGAATLIGPTGASGNGLTFLDDGRLVMSGGGRLYELNRATGAATVIGSFGPGVSSSGDLTGTPAGALYLTSPGDRLVRLNRSTGRATTIGMTGFSEVYGLAYWDGVVYGFTSSGGIIAINEATGRGTSVFTGGDTYWGAAVNQLLW
jgi:hypothetical protein